MTLGNCRSASVGLFLSAVWLTAGDRPLEAHGSEARYVEVVPWQKERFSRVLAVSRSELGTPGTSACLLDQRHMQRDRIRLLKQLIERL